VVPVLLEIGISAMAMGDVAVAMTVGTNRAAAGAS
jgi:hypothetical protein